ncbi:MAG: hypothetical protein ACUZ77_01870 [Candidatus Brocadiales bacterium]
MENEPLEEEIKLDNPVNEDKQVLEQKFNELIGKGHSLIAELISPVDCLMEYKHPNLDSFYMSIEEVKEWKRDLEIFIKENVNMPEPLLEGIDRQLNLEHLLKIDRFDFTNDVIWSHKKCAKLRYNFGIDTEESDDLNSQFYKAKDSLKRNYKDFSAFTSKHVRKNGFKIRNAKMPTPDVQVPAPKFDFIKTNPKLKAVLERDFSEIQKCLASDCWKASIILCGSAIEAILYYVLKQRENEALASKNSNRKDKLEEWNLVTLIKVASDLKLIKEGVTSFSHSVRDYRNLVHPLKEVEGNYNIAGEEARASFETLKMVIRDLVK